MARVERDYNRPTDVIMLTPGQRFGPFEVVETLGAGGMGHVYRARDPRLNRDVALKVIADALPPDAERVARFRREAQVLASLNHAHIGAIFGVEEADGTTALILELVDGPTLADRIAEGPLPVAEALTIARQIAEAIQAAHEQGILHRDLKPANIKLRPDGTVKVLDFGLAKAVVGDAAVAPRSTASMSPTLTTPAMTGVGVILGTAAYMAPEQAKGKPLDKRADIWAFGCVLYETLTGRRAFEGEDVSDTLAAVLRGDPDWRSLPTDLAPALRAMLEGCLAKDRRDRIADFSTILFVLNKAPRLFEAQPASTSGKSRRAWYGAGLAVAALAASAVTGALMRQPPDKPPALARFSLPLPEGQIFTSTGRQAIAISPDGTALAYIANSRIFLRPIADVEPRAVAGTEMWGSISNLTFSPDGQSLAFWAQRDSSLKRISIAGGAAFTICPVSTNPLGVSWADADVLFSDFSGIQRVAEDGGKPELVVPRGTADDGGLVMYGPQQIADDAIMFTIASRDAATAVDRWDRARIVVHSLRSGQRRTIVEGGSDARYVSTGHLIYALGGVLFAAPFDRNRLETTGPGVPVIEGVLRTFAANSAPMHAALSSNGSLLYVPGPASLTGIQSSLGIADRKGAVEVLKLSPAAFANPRVSPDGTRLAYQVDDDRQSNIWVYPLSGTSAAQQITFGGKNQYPVWSPDGLRIAFASDRDGDAGLFSQPAAGGPAERLTRADQNVAHVPTSWSPDGETLLFEANNGSEVSLWMMTMSDRKTVPFSDVRARNISIGATFSPDGRWVAYQTGGYAGDRTFVEPFPPTGTKHQIERGGRPLWSRDGKELFFVPLPGQFSVVGITTQPAFSFTTPTSVPRAFPLADPMLQRPFDMTADGRFVVVTAGDAQVLGGVRRMELVLNWTQELARRVPVH